MAIGTVTGIVVGTAEGIAANRFRQMKRTGPSMRACFFKTIEPQQGMIPRDERGTRLRMKIMLIEPSMHS
ncbi:hypothetical protein [Bradyrhizobium sp. dw_78]|uniref:hypothetical protein n=1 Tax=Bradyrhizobium sp. dw_78 TaxID=2719793 RepID=UPI001BD2B9ED|nr:hypothetical protein [Bradyrhizobium sp. dw_78]